MPKVVKGPELGPTGTGLECNATQPFSPSHQPRGTGFYQQGKENTMGAGRAGSCSSRDFRLQEGLTSGL